MDHEAAAIRNMWQAVVVQAVIDACSVVRKWEPAENRLARSQSRRWLINNCGDFKLVCDYAGYNPDDIRERAIKLARSGWQREADNE